MGSQGAIVSALTPGSTHPAGRAESPRVLIVENQAHVRAGHFPVQCAELAAALHHEGAEVTLLTPRGWALETAGEEAPFSIRRLGRLSYSLYLRGKLFDRWPPRRDRWASTAWRDAIMGVFARRVARQLGGADLIVTSLSSDPLVWATIAGNGRLLIYQFFSPEVSRSKLLLSISRRAEKHRRIMGGMARVAVNHDDARVRHLDLTPWLDPALLPFIASNVIDPVPGARAQLGLAPDARLALMFGGVHVGKDPEVVWRAFQKLAEWQLVIAGAGAVEAYRAWRANQGHTDVEPVLFEGFASDELRRLLHSAADLVILSFQAGSEQDSGTLVDAVSYGLPVVCSDRSAPGRLTEQLGIGRVFSPGDTQSLVNAVRSVPLVLDAVVLAKAREQTSASRMARMHLAALGRRPDQAGP